MEIIPLTVLLLTLTHSPLRRVVLEASAREHHLCLSAATWGAVLLLSQKFETCISPGIHYEMDPWAKTKILWKYIQFVISSDIS